jgi:TRAP-type C4-dicarboxylate transport system substrate-binding protein
MEKRKFGRFMGELILILGMITGIISGPLAPESFAAPIELKFASNVSDRAAISTDFVKRWGSEVEKATGGRVKVTYYFNQSLLKQGDMYDGVAKGIADVCWGLGSWFPNRFPLSTITELPSPLTTAAAGSKVIWELYDKYLKNEYKDVKVLELSTASPKYLFFVTKPIKTMEDLKGTRVDAVGRTEGKIVQLLGGSPQVVPFPELYSGLERGIIDGGLLATGGVSALRLQEVLKYFNDFPFGMAPGFMVMNKAKWEKLPADIQKQIEPLCGEYASNLHGTAWDSEEITGRKALAAKGVLPYHMTPDETKRWGEVLAPLAKDWINEMEGKGLPGQKMYEDYTRLVNQYAPK